MSLFENGVEVKGSLETQTEEFLKECENVMNVAYKASGVSIMDAMNGLDAESGAVVGAAMTLYRKKKDLALKQAKAMDNLQNSFNGLKEMNKKMLAQNEQLQRMLQDMNSQEKAEKKK